jgi:hypothetical protein
MAAVSELANDVGTSAACQALYMPRASYYRDRRKTSSPALTASRPSPARALRPAEREVVLSRLHEERFQDRSPAAVYATLLDEGEYHCSIRTMHRLLKQSGESRERRDQLVHPPYQKPELLATAPNQLWSWDITKLLGPAKWTYFYLYVMAEEVGRLNLYEVAYGPASELHHMPLTGIIAHELDWSKEALYIARGALMGTTVAMPTILRWRHCQFAFRISRQLQSNEMARLKYPDRVRRKIGIGVVCAPR